MFFPNNEVVFNVVSKVEYKVILIWRWLGLANATRLFVVELGALSVYILSAFSLVIFVVLTT
jgi:hypothetical protein